MADTYSSPEPKTGSDDHADLLKTAADEWRRAFEHDRANIEHAYADLRLLVGDDEEHWGPGVKAERETQGRACLTVNALPQYVEQITGDQRKLSPAMRVRPVDSRATKETAEIIAGLIRYVELRSSAQAVYNQACDSQVACGIGHWRVVTEYAADTTFNQEIGVRPVDDQVMVLWDPDSTELTRADAMFAYEPVDLSRPAFERKYPGKVPQDFNGEKNSFGFGPDWYGEDYVRVARRWWKEPHKKLLLLLPDGSVDDLTDDEDAEQKIAFAQSPEGEAHGFRVEERDAFCVYHALVSCDEVLEEAKKWPGRYIPLIPVIGRERRIGRRVVREGAIRHARDPSRAYNFSTSAHVEHVAMQPKAPFVATEAMVENHLDQWEMANRENRPFLTYTPDPMAPGLRPERQAPPAASPGLEACIVQASQDIERTTGIYKSMIGADSREESGKAISLRDEQGDTATFVFVQNRREAVAHTARVIIDLIPHVYDTARTQRIVHEDGSEELVPVNQPQGLAVDGAVEKTLHDLTVGAYDVVPDSGPSFTTKAEEARVGMKELVQAVPDVFPRIGDLFVKAQDWPMADEIAERIKPPDVRAQEAQEEAQEAMQKGQQPPPPPPQQPPSPEQQAEAQKAQLEQQKLGFEAQKAQADHQVKLAELQIKARELEMKEAELALRARELDAENQRTALEAHTRREEAVSARAVSQDERADKAAERASDGRLDALEDQVSQLTALLGQLFAPPQAGPSA